MEIPGWNIGLAWALGIALVVGLAVLTILEILALWFNDEFPPHYVFFNKRTLEKIKRAIKGEKKLREVMGGPNMSTKELSEIILKDFIILPGKITATKSADFVYWFKKLLDTEPASQHRGVVYVYLCEQPIPRLKGNSNILYIGKSDLTMRKGLLRWANIEGSDYNWSHYQYIIKEYGPITLGYAEYNILAATPKNAEKQLLDMYLAEHLEYPPLNRASS